MSSNRVTVILNASSGRQRGDDTAEEIRSAFEARGVTPEMVVVKRGTSIEKAAKEARDGPSEVVVVAGGDGTICGVASALAGSDKLFGIIPAGTFNYFGRSLDLPEDVQQAVETIVGGKTRKSSVATINDTVFLNNASLGAYAAILQTREGIYKRWGRSRFAAYWSVIKALATLRSPLKITLTVDGEEFRYRTPLVFAINNAFQLDQMGLGGRECIEAGQLVVMVAPNTNRLGLLWNAARLAVGMAKKETDYHMHCGTEIDIKMKRHSRPVARDGELGRMRGPLKLRIQRDALNLIVPADLDREVR